MSIVIPAWAPTGARILVKPIKPQMKTNAGIFLASADDKNPPMGVILAIGPDVNFSFHDGSVLRKVKEGDRVIYERHSGTSYLMNVADNDSKIEIVLWGCVMMVLPPEEDLIV